MNSFTSIDEIGEFGLIARAAAVLGNQRGDNVVLGIGDDAAVIDAPVGGLQLICTDALIEGVHFDLSFMPPALLGYKSISVNVSDIAAMNGTPSYATIALGIPQRVSVEMVESFYAGVGRAAEQFGVRIVGGDTTAARQLTICVTMVGSVAQEAITYRSGAQPGDLLCVSGDLGAAYAGLRVLIDEVRRLRESGESFEPEVEAFRHVIARQLEPTARMDIVRLLKDAGIVPKAAIDLSDGLGSDLHHLCTAGAVGAVVEVAALPVHEETRRVARDRGDGIEKFALYGGEDYELLLAIGPGDVERLPAHTLAVVGEIVKPEQGVSMRAANGELSPLSARGYDHFANENTNGAPD